MGVTFAPVFNRKGLKNKSKLYSIHLRIIIDRKVNYINPKLPKIKKEFWQGKENKWVKESYRGSFEINSLLQKKISELDSFILKLLIWEKPITFEAIHDFYFVKGNNNDFNDFIDDYIKNIKGLEYNTIKTYRTFQKHFNKFKPSVKYNELTEQLLHAFKNYLQIEKKIGGGATKKYFSKFRIIYKAAAHQNLLDINQNPFNNIELRIRVEKAIRVYLEVEEIKALKDLQFSNAIENENLIFIRDMFLFLIYTGMYYSDLKKFKKENLLLGDSGYYIIDKRSKNQNRMIIPLYKFPNAIKLLEKYKSDDDEYVFVNQLSDQHFNRGLKEIAEMCGIKKKLTNKVGRHTNAQLWMSMGVERQFVSKMLGHTKESTTQHYYDLSIHNIDTKIKSVNFDEIEI